MDFFNKRFRWKSYKRLSYKYSYGLTYLVHDFIGNKFIIKIDDSFRIKKNDIITTLIQKINSQNLNLIIPQIIEYGLFNYDKNSYSIFSWIEGNNLFEIMENLPYLTRYKLGLMAGQYLLKIHNLPVEARHQRSNESVNGKRYRKVSHYLNSSKKIKNHDLFINFLNENSGSIRNFKTSYIHNKFCVENIVINNLQMGFVNFDRITVDDPIYDLVKIQLYNNDTSYSFCLGVLEGYFNGRIPNNFWQKYATLTVYECISIAMKSYKNNTWQKMDVDKITDSVLKEYNNLTTYIPNWYKKMKITPIEKQFSFSNDITSFLFE